MGITGNSIFGISYELRYLVKMRMTRAMPALSFSISVANIALSATPISSRYKIDLAISIIKNVEDYVSITENTLNFV